MFTHGVRRLLPCIFPLSHNTTLTYNSSFLHRHFGSLLVLNRYDKRSYSSPIPRVSINARHAVSVDEADVDDSIDDESEEEFDDSLNLRLLDSKYIDRQRIGQLSLPLRLYEPIEELVGMKASRESGRRSSSSNEISSITNNDDNSNNNGDSGNLTRNDVGVSLLKTIGDWELEWKGLDPLSSLQLPPPPRSDSKTIAITAQRLSQNLRERSQSPLQLPVKQLSDTLTPESSRFAVNANVSHTATSLYTSDNVAIAYAAVRMPAIYASLIKIFSEIIHRQILSLDDVSNNSTLRVLDFGSGTGTAAWAVMDMWSRHSHSTPTIFNNIYFKSNDSEKYRYDNVQVVAIEPSQYMRSIGKVIGTSYSNVGSVHWKSTLSDTSSVDDIASQPFDIVVASHVFGEISTIASRKAVLNKLWRRVRSNGGVLVVVEAGSPNGFETVQLCRSHILRKNMSSAITISPCSHDGMCPLLKHSLNRDKIIKENNNNNNNININNNNNKISSDVLTKRDLKNRQWCHFSQRFQRPRLVAATKARDAKDSRSKGLPFEDEKYSFIVLQKWLTDDVTIDDDVDNVDDTITEHSSTNSEMDNSHRNEIINKSMMNIIAERQKWSRIVRPPMKRSGHVLIDVCAAIPLQDNDENSSLASQTVLESQSNTIPANITRISQGILDRRTVTKKYGSDAYRSSRRSWWGDRLVSDLGTVDQGRRRFK